MLHPNYLYKRVRELKNLYRVRVILCLVDLQDNEGNIGDHETLGVSRVYINSNMEFTGNRTLHRDIQVI